MDQRRVRQILEAIRNIFRISQIYQSVTSCDCLASHSMSTVVLVQWSMPTNFTYKSYMYVPATHQ